jgi:hypothetical protein
MIVGAFIHIAALSLMFNYNIQAPVIYIVFTGIIGGIASASFQTSNSSIIMGSVNPDQRGAASAMMAVVISMSISLGMAWAGTVFSISKSLQIEKLITQSVEKAQASQQAVPFAFHNTILVSICIATILIISVLISELFKRQNNITI